MNFLNFLTSKASLLNFNLLDQSASFQRENTILVQPSPQCASNATDLSKEKLKSESDFHEKSEDIMQKNIMAGEITQLLTQEQMLINQYMDLKMKYLTTCLSINQSKSPELNIATTSIKKDEEAENELKNELKEDQTSMKKKIKKKNKCGHDDKTHYAKGMCNNCYHKYGRTKKPWNCPHDKLYAAGMCQNCYINNYNRKKRSEKQGEKQSHEKEDVQSMEESAE